MESRVTVVIATRDRRAELVATLGKLRELSEASRVIVVDNGSSDGTVEAVRDGHPWARIVALGENRGAAARSVGVREAETPCVAFSDDDSWWEPGSLALAADRLDAHRRLALIAARVLVGPGREVDPTSAAMAASPLPVPDGLSWPAVLGFLACGAVVRRSAFLEVGGFEPRFGVGGEEQLLAIDLASAGWDLVYCDDIVAHHHPTASGPRPGRRRVQVRNALWAAWLRRPAWVGLRPVVTEGLRDAEARAGLRDALAGLPWALRHRRRVPDEVERALRALGH